MICDVYPLRRLGAKLPREALVAVRGRLRIERGGLIVGLRGKRPYRSITAKVHTMWPPSYPGHAAATLHGATITRLDERGFVLTGSEVVTDGLGAHTYDQAWFCRPVPDAEAARYREPAWIRDAPPPGSDPS